MTVSCNFCDKQFANKRSLASHQSRFHREPISDRDSNSSVPAHGNDDLSNVSIRKPKNDNSFTEDSDEESNASDNTLSSATASTPLPQEKESGSYSAKSTISDQGSESDDSKENYSQMDAGNEYSSSSEDDDSDSGTRAKDSIAADDRYSGVKRKTKVNVPFFNNKLIEVLRSIESLLNRQSCKEEDDCFDFLFSYKLKKKVFAELGNFFAERGIDIKTLLSDDELLFIDALLNTTNLSDLRKLMNENIGMVKSILERHVITSKDKKQKYNQ